MFVSQAHSFARQARLAVTLAWVAGYTNIVTILTCGTVTSHVSGTTSNLGRDLLEGYWSPAASAAFLLATFLVGAAASGFCTELGRRRGWESIYLLPVICEAVLLTLFAAGIAVHGTQPADSDLLWYVLTGAASSAMGLQNATITRISSGNVRTTHVTGVLTDLGLEIGQLAWRLRDRLLGAPTHHAENPAANAPMRISRRRLALLASVIGTFALGAGLGTLAHDYAPQWAMCAPVAFLVWIIFQDRIRPIAEIEPVHIAGTDDALSLPTALAVYHLRKDHDREGEVQRMPNLLAWADRLSPATRVVILDLGEAAQLDENAALEIRAALARLASQGRQMIVAGLSADLYRRMRHAASDNLPPLENVCPDFELAVARGLTLVHDLAVRESTHRRAA